MLKHVHTRIEDVQHQIQQLLPSDAILVGHSLNFDLDALQVSVVLEFVLHYWLFGFFLLLQHGEWVYFLLITNDISSLMNS